MLHRRFLRGDLPPAEWEYRRRQPMHFGGPVNLRPYMDPEWQRKGGATEVALAIDYYECTLPFMPTPFRSRRDEGVPRDHLGAPPFAMLMSSERFFYRGQLCRQQLKRIMSNPLAMDIASARQPTYMHRKRIMATHWLAEKKGDPLPDLPTPAQAKDSVPADCVFANGLASVGQMSLILPANYPLPQGHPLSVRTPRPANPHFGNLSEGPASEPPSLLPPLTTSDADALLRITDETTFLHSRPTEFFLGNGTERGQLGLWITFDRNTYTTADVKEFVEECRLAILHYLGAAVASKGKL
uniref:Transcription factor MBP1 n=1 Tax=Ganoderma boninense TaxID=34458 RepID=A0A5K1K0W3_9APHY|nr:Transcription factor MBP1 [Ganoderma boninense]